MIKVIVVASGADGFCTSCAGGCLSDALHLWPDFDWDGLLTDDSMWPKVWPDYPNTGGIDPAEMRALLHSELEDR